MNARAASGADSEFRILFEAIPDPAWIIHGDAFVEVNAAALLALGFDDRGSFLQIPPAEISPAFQPVGQATRNHAERISNAVSDTPSHRFECVCRRRDGRLIPAEVTMTPIQWGGAPAICYIWRDLTQHRTAASNPRETEGLLRRLPVALEQCAERIVITDAEARCAYVNGAFLRATGYTTDEVIGRNLRLLRPGNPPRTNHDDLWDQLAAGRSWQGECINRRKDGTEYAEWASITPLRQPDGRITHYMAVMWESTEGQSTEAPRQAQQATAIAWQARSDVLANISHEIRTPMNAMLGLTQILERGELSADQRDLLHKITESGELLLLIINDILDLAKIEAGQLKLERHPFELTPILTRAESHSAKLARDRGIVVVVRAPGDCRARLSAIHRASNRYCPD